MAALGDIVAGIRKVILLEHRVETLTSEVLRLSAAHEETRERLIRLEVIIDEARRTAAAKEPRQRRME